jgi:hypothetical protein
MLPATNARRGGLRSRAEGSPWSGAPVDASAPVCPARARAPRARVKPLSGHAFFCIGSPMAYVDIRHWHKMREKRHLEWGSGRRVDGGHQAARASVDAPGGASGPMAALARDGRQKIYLPPQAATSCCM